MSRWFECDKLGTVRRLLNDRKARAQSTGGTIDPTSAEQCNADSAEQGRVTEKRRISVMRRECLVSRGW